MNINCIGNATLVLAGVLGGAQFVGFGVRPDREMPAISAAFSPVVASDYQAMSTGITIAVLRRTARAYAKHVGTNDDTSNRTTYNVLAPTVSAARLEAAHLPLSLPSACGRFREHTYPQARSEAAAMEL